jgi:hypothetical protein
LTYADLDEKWAERVASPEPLVSHLVDLIQARQSSLGRVPIFPSGEAVYVNPWLLDLSTRTRTGLLRCTRGGRGAGRLRKLTFDEFLDVPGIGTRSLLELATVADQAAQAYDLDPSQREAPAKAPLGSQRPSREPDEADFSADQRRALESLMTSEFADLHLDDPRLGDLRHKQGPRTVGQWAARQLKRGVTKRRSANSILDEATALTRVGERLLNQDLQAALTEVVSAFNDLRDKRLEALTDRLGISGPKVTLENAARLAGLTRARIGQLEVRLQKRLASQRGSLFLPQFDGLLAVLVCLPLPVPLRDIPNLLAERGVDIGDSDLAALLKNFSKHVRGNRTLDVDTDGSQSWLFDHRNGELADQLRNRGFDARASISIARKLCRSVGMASLSWISEEAGAPTDPESLRLTSQLIKDAAWSQMLDDEWFVDTHVAPGRNRLLNNLYKLLSVRNPLPIDTLQTALDRVRRQGRLPHTPPRHALELFAQAHPELFLEDGSIASHEPLDPRHELSPTEVVFFDVLTIVPGGVLDRESLFRACSERGMGTATFAQYTSFSPIIERVGSNAWALVGTEVTENDLVRIPRRRWSRRSTAHWTASGTLLCTFVVTSPEASVFTVPAEGREEVAGRRFSATNANEADVGTIVVGDKGTSWGYGRFLTTSGVRAADRLLVEFDVRRGSARLSIERDEDDVWIGDLPNCYLLERGWTLGLFVDHAILTGADWQIPDALADAVGIPPGPSVLLTDDPNIEISVRRTAERCTAGSLESVLEPGPPATGDRLLIAIRDGHLRIRVQAAALLREGTPMKRLEALLGCENGRHPTPAERWGRLSRAVGGSGTGGRDEVASRLRERRDVVALGLLGQIGPIASQSEGDWPSGWWLTTPLDPDTGVFAVRRTEGFRRIAIGVRGTSSAPPSGCHVTPCGLMWIDDALDDTRAGQNDVDQPQLAVHQDAEWVSWARGIHAARLLALSGAGWRVEHGAETWTLSGREFLSLVDAFLALPATDVAVRTAPIGPTVEFPRTAFAFRRSAARLVVRGITAIAADPEHGFRAEFADGHVQVGVFLSQLA